MRINKYIAHAGVASRRKAEELIKEGRVTLNGKTVTELATIVKNGDIKGGKTESLIHGLAKRSGYEPLQGGKYGSNNGFDHVLVGKDGSVVIIDSKQIKTNGAIQVSSKGAGDTNQLSSKWINAVLRELSENDPTKLAIKNAEKNGKSIKTIIAGVDKSNGKVVLLPVRIPNKN